MENNNDSIPNANTLRILHDYTKDPPKLLSQKRNRPARINGQSRIEIEIAEALRKGRK